MLQVSSPSKFPEDCHIAFFSGKNIEDALRLAREWSSRTGIEILNYYPQRAFGKSILVSYKKENENDRH